MNRGKYILQCLFILLHFLCHAQNPALDPGMADLPPGMDEELPNTGAGAAPVAPGGIAAGGTAQEAQMLQGPDIIDLSIESSLKATNPQSLELYIKKKESIKIIRNTLQKLEEGRDQVEERILEIDNGLGNRIIDMQSEAGRYQQITEMQNEPEVENEA